MISVYHLKGDTFLDRLRDPPLEPVVRARIDWSTDRYELVADILDRDDPEDGYRLTQNVTGPWKDHAEVEARYPGHDVVGCRSTSVGDIVKTDTGTFLVMRVGMQLI